MFYIITFSLWNFILFVLIIPSIISFFPLDGGIAWCFQTSIVSFIDMNEKVQWFKWHVLKNILGLEGI